MLMNGGEKMRGWLRAAREEKGMTQLQVAQALGITESYYSFIEKAQRQKKMDITLVWRLSEVFGIPVQQIINYENSAG